MNLANLLHEPPTVIVNFKCVSPYISFLYLLNYMKLINDDDESSKRFIIFSSLNYSMFICKLSFYGKLYWFLLLFYCTNFLFTLKNLKFYFYPLKSLKKLFRTVNVFRSYSNENLFATDMLVGFEKKKIFHRTAWVSSLHLACMWESFFSSSLQKKSPNQHPTMCMILFLFVEFYF